MAAYFNLTPRCDPGNGPMSLADIDNGIRQFLGLGHDAERYAFGWYDSIGFMLAMGSSWDRVDCMILEWINRSKATQAKIEECQLMAISQWLQQNYIVSAWYGR